MFQVAAIVGYKITLHFVLINVCNLNDWRWYMVERLFCLKACSVDIKRIEKVCYFILLSIACVLLIDMMLSFCEIKAFRHDELRYIDSYFTKLVTEGRWLNYLFFSVLKISNVKIVAVINVISFFIFSYICFLNIFEKKYAMLCAMASLFIPPIHLLNEWAQTSMISFLLLAIAAIVYKKISMPLFFLIFSILFNGCLSHFYFLLPLLFIGNGKNIFHIICCWCILFVVGFLFAELIVFVLSNRFITIADWRHPNYIKDIFDFIYNVEKTIGSFVGIVKKIGIFLWGAFMVAFIISLSAWMRKKNKEKIFQILLLCMVAASIFALSVSAGLGVDTRSAACLFIAFLFFISISFKYNKFLLFLFVLGFIAQFYVHNMNNINYIKIIPDIWISELKKISPDPRALSGVILLSSQEEFKKHERKLLKNNMLKHDSTEHLGELMRWAPAAYEFGFRHIHHAQWKKDYLKDINMDIEYDDFLFKKEFVYEYAIINNYLVLRVI